MPILSMEYEEVTLEKVFLELTSGAPSPKTAKLSAEEAPASAEDAFVQAALENMKKKQEETMDEPAPAEKEEKTADTKKAEKPAKSPKNDKNDDDYTPLFG